MAIFKNLIRLSFIIFCSPQVFGITNTEGNQQKNEKRKTKGEIPHRGNNLVIYSNILFLGNSTMVPIYDLFVNEKQPYASTKIAVWGHTINQQLAAWKNLITTQKQSFDYVLVQIGLNDLDGSTYIRDYQTLINQIKTDKKSSCRIIAATESPAREKVNYTNWQALNTAIRRSGPTPISGIDHVMTTNTTRLDVNGDGYLDSSYNSGDGIHPNSTGNQIIKNNYLDLLASLYVTPPPPAGLVNLAKSRPVKQSSTNYGGIPEKAVDGNTDGDWSNASVSHTAVDVNAWWEVDLGNKYSINNIEVWNRTNTCCVARLSNFYVFVSDVPFTSKSLNTTMNQSGVWRLLTSAYPNPVGKYTLNRSGRYVRVQLGGTGELNLAEVKVMGQSGAITKSTEETLVSPDSAELNITVYPVPFSDILRVNSNEVISHIEIFNVLGEKVLSIESNAESNEINTSSFSPGYYFIRVTTMKNHVETYPVMKQYLNN